MKRIVISGVMASGLLGYVLLDLLTQGPREQDDDVHVGSASGKAVGSSSQHSDEATVHGGAPEQRSASPGVAEARLGKASGPRERARVTLVDRFGTAPVQGQTPRDGEGAPEDDWDDIEPVERVRRATDRIELLEQRVSQTDTPTARRELATQAATELSAVRAEFSAIPGGEAKYEELEARVESLELRN